MKAGIYWKLTFFRDKSYSWPVRWFIDWVRYWDYFNGVRGFDD